MPLVALGVCLMLLGAMFVSVPLLALYPDLRYISAPWDERTEREQEVVRRYLRFTSRVTFWERVRRLLTIPCGAKRRPSRREVRRATRFLGEH